MLTSPAFVNEECWATSGVNGYSAFSDSGYRFETDRLTGGTVLCLTPIGASRSAGVRVCAMS